MVPAARVVDPTRAGIPAVGRLVRETREVKVTAEGLASYTPEEEVVEQTPPEEV
jgi:hypothetical protein